MSLDATAREANARDSIKKFCVENIYDVYGIHITFDTSLSAPKIQGREVDKWVTFKFGMFNPSHMGDWYIEAYLCTKMDKEGFKLAQLRDKVVGVFTDTTTTDGLKRITLYRSHESEAWTAIGYLLVTEIIESGQMEAEDETKFKILTVRLRWSAKI